MAEQWTDNPFWLAAFILVIVTLRDIAAVITRALL